MMFICPNCGDKRCPHAADHREACGAGALPDEAKDAALVEVGNRLAGALEVLSTAIRNNGSSEFVSALIAEWRAAAIETHKGGKDGR